MYFIFLNGHVAATYAYTCTSMPTHTNVRILFTHRNSPIYVCHTKCLFITPLQYATHRPP